MAEEARVMADLHGTDPHAWSMDQAEALRAMVRVLRRARQALAMDWWPEVASNEPSE